MGQSVKIPVIVRSLAIHLHHTDGRIRFPMDEELVRCLSAGLADEPGAGVKKFIQPWWHQNGHPGANLLCQRSVKDHLEFHRNEMRKVAGAGAGAVPTSRPAISVDKHRYSWHDSVFKMPDGKNCPRCPLYRAVALGAIDKIKSELDSARGARVASSTEAKVAMRRASAFNQVFEAAVIREGEVQTGGPAMGTEGRPGMEGQAGAEGQAGGRRNGKARETETQRRAEEFRLASEAELGRLQNAPNVKNVKWTSGAVLSYKDLLGLVRAADANLELPHSGYDDSLEDGSLRPDSKGRSKADMKKGDAPFLDVGSSVEEDDPELSESEQPVVFEQRPLNRLLDSPQTTPSMMPAGPTPWLRPASRDYIQIPRADAGSMSVAVHPRPTVASRGLSPFSITDDDAASLPDDDAASLPDVIEILSSDEERQDLHPAPQSPIVIGSDTDLPPFISVNNVESPGSPGQQDSLDFLSSVQELYIPEEEGYASGSEEESMVGMVEVGTVKLYVPPDSDEEY
jgi:hypothetical protein